MRLVLRLCFTDAQDVAAWLCMLAARITHGFLLFEPTYDFKLQLLRLQLALAVWTMIGDALPLRFLSPLHQPPFSQLSKMACAVPACKDLCKCVLQCRSRQRLLHGHGIPVHRPHPAHHGLDSLTGGPDAGHSHGTGGDGGKED